MVNARITPPSASATDINCKRAAGGIVQCEAATQRDLVVVRSRRRCRYTGDRKGVAGPRSDREGACVELRGGSGSANRNSGARVEDNTGGNRARRTQIAAVDCQRAAVSAGGVADGEGAGAVFGDGARATDHAGEG